ncbi:hypothetical protein J2S43_005681 [Catenuloplanes nepalensis]|uniref:Uncharacterized protein n=1 Tax=Catenuloplanes nepalensis TaxID=587533 RepID=A0ABT9N0E6_9ACTN|nr:DNA mismatch repair protein MutL [Catenuloplanes nepalensis]MDP9797169.1 hypothetical protein [Catenuloplanes nepalensis]
MRIWQLGGGAVAWVLATVLGAVTVWVGLRPVLNTALPDRAIPLSASDLRRLSPAPVPPVSTLPSESTPSVTPSAPASTPAADPPVPTPSRTAARSSAPTEQQAAPAPKQTVVNGWIATEVDGKVTYVRSFKVDGGQAVIQIVDQVVSLESATPATGFAADTAQPSPERLVVRFTGGGRAYTIDALWFNNGPFHEVTES